MRPFAFKRQIDELGRIVLPAEFREQLGVSPGDVLQIVLHRKELRLTKSEKETAKRNHN